MFSMRSFCVVMLCFALLSVWVCNGLCVEPVLTQKPAENWVTAPVRAEGVEQVIFKSKAAKSDVSYFICRPEGYSKDKERRYPVVYWLHGSGGGNQGVPVISALFRKAIQDNKIPPLILVFPNGMSSSMWCDSKDGKVPMETVVVKELIPHIDATEQSIATREGRILEGFSMGGYGTGRLGFKYPELFAGLSLFGAGPVQKVFEPEKTPRADPLGARRLFADVYGNDQEYFYHQSPWYWAEKNASELKSGIKIRVAIGGRDSTLENNKLLDARLTELKIPHSFTVVPGVPHNPKQLLEGLGEKMWEFYREVLKFSI